MWIIIYQADVRARLEHVERMRRKGMKLHGAGAATGERVFDVNRPWDWSFHEVLADGAFWKRELEEPALLVLSHAGALASMVDGDALTAGGSKPAAAAPHPHAGAPHAAGRSAAKVPAQKRFREHQVDANGRLSHNRKGSRLCTAFQSGQCSTSGFVCHDGSTHQCNKCLAPGHGGDSCTQPAAKAPVLHARSSGAKGGGKGGGKGGKKFGRAQW